MPSVLVGSFVKETGCFVTMLVAAAFAEVATGKVVVPVAVPLKPRIL